MKIIEERKCSGFLASLKVIRDGEVVKEVKNVPNLILNGMLTGGSDYVQVSGGSADFYTSTTPNFEDLGGTWTQSDGAGGPGNTVTRATGSATFPSSPSQIGNELKFEDGERCHVTARASDTSITVSGPPRYLVGKTIRRYYTVPSVAGAIHTGTLAASRSTDLVLGTDVITRTGISNVSPSDYTLGSIIISGWARIVLPVPIAILTNDQIEVTYICRVEYTGRGNRVIPMSSVIAGYPVQYPIATMSGNGTTVTIVTSAAHHFLTGDQIEVPVAVPLRTTISSITASGSAWTVTATGQNKAPGDTVVIENCSVAGYNGTHTVATAPDANTITITNATNPGAASNGTVRLATPVGYFGGSYVVASVPNSTTVTALSAHAGPAIDTSSVLTSIDELTYSVTGAMGGIGNTNQARLAFNESNKKSIPAIDVGLIAVTGSSHGSFGTGPSNFKSSPTHSNDFTTSTQISANNSWGAGGSSEPRFAQFAIKGSDINIQGGSPLHLFTFTVPQPKLSSHRFQYPRVYQKVTRELP